MVDIPVSKTGFWPAMLHAEVEGWFIFCHAARRTLEHILQKSPLPVKWCSKTLVPMQALCANYCVTLIFSQQGFDLVSSSGTHTTRSLPWWFDCISVLVLFAMQSMIWPTMAQGRGSRIWAQPQHQCSVRKKNGLSVREQSCTCSDFAWLCPICTTSIHAATKHSERKCNVL